MVKIAIFNIILLSISLNSGAQSPDYLKEMKENIRVLDSVNNVNSLISIAQQFEKISDSEVKEWLPVYYSAYGLAKAAFEVQDNDTRDKFTDLAIEKTEKALVLAPSESELYTLLGFSYLSKMNTGSTIRAMKYLPKAKQVLNKAKQLNPANPRPYYLLGNIIYFTPKIYGGGKEKAMPLLNEAIDKFNQFKPVSDIMPVWGKKDCLDLINSK